MKDNPFDILGLDHNATTDEIKKQYKKLVKQYHPDLDPNNKEKFQKIQWAYENIHTVPRKKSHVNVDDLFNAFKKPSYREKTVTVKTDISLSDIENKIEKIIQFYDNGPIIVKYIPSLGINKIRTHHNNTYYSITIDQNIVDKNYTIVDNKLVLKVFMSAHDFHTLNSIVVDTFKQTLKIKLTEGTNTSQMMKINGAGLHGSPLYISLVVTK